jgi:hypothetical protein
MSSLSELKKKMKAAKEKEQAAKAAQAVEEVEETAAATEEAPAEVVAESPKEEAPPAEAPAVQPVAPAAVSLPATLSVKRMFTSAGTLVAEDEDQSELTVLTINPNARVCRVTAGGGLTVNLGDFNSAKFQASVEVPAYLEEIDEAMAYARKVVNDELNRQAAELSEGDE